MKRVRPLLGTFVEIAIADAGQLTEQQVQVAVTAAFDCVEKIQQQLSFHNPQSDLTRLNCSLMEWKNLQPFSIHCLKLARALTRISCGKFNCTLGKSVADKGALPTPASTHAPLSIGSWQDIEIRGHQARLRCPLWITLDGIAKGFTVDAAIKTLQLHGIKSAWVNAGGDIRVYGSTIIPISIRDHNNQDHPMGGLQNAAIATSTSLFSAEHPGLLLDNKGEQIAAATWSVMALSAWRADALTKVAANVPEAERKAYVRRLGGNWIPVSAATFSSQLLSK